MKIKNKLKNYGFWTALLGAAALVLQAFGVKVDAPYLNEALSAVSGILVALGIVSNPESGRGFLDRDDKGDGTEEKG